MGDIELLTRIDCRNELGEGVVWNERQGCVMWTDIESSCLYRSYPPFSEVERFDAPERIGSFALLADTDDIVLAAFESGFGFFEFAASKVSWIDRPALPPESRFNDGRTDRNGVFWAGLMIEDKHLRRDAQGSLFRLSPEGRAEAKLTGLMVSNSLCWSLDGTQMYFADSPTHEIRRYPANNDAEMAGEIFATSPRGGVPDGSTIDAEGCLWNAEWGAGRVVRYTPDGAIDTVLDVPAPQVTCPAFGGDNFDLLFVTSARIGLSDEVLNASPQSGSLFIYKTPYRGLPEDRCRAPRPA